MQPIESKPHAQSLVGWAPLRIKFWDCDPPTYKLWTPTYKLWKSYVQTLESYVQTLEILRPNSDAPTYKLWKSYAQTLRPLHTNSGDPHLRPAHCMDDDVTSKYRGSLGRLLVGPWLPLNLSNTLGTSF